MTDDASQKVIFQKLDIILEKVGDQNGAIRLLQFQVKILWSIAGFVGLVAGSFLLKKVLDVVSA